MSSLLMLRRSPVLPVGVLTVIERGAQLDDDARGVIDGAGLADDVAHRDRVAGTRDVVEEAVEEA